MLKFFHKVCFTAVATLVVLTLVVGTEVVSDRSTTRVEGVVQTLGDEPVDGVWVTLIRRSPEALVDPDVAAMVGGSDVVRVRSGEDGGFRLDLPAGHYDVRAYESGFLTFANPEPIEVRGSSKARIQVNLEPSASISGRVVGLEGSLDRGMAVAFAEGEDELPVRESRLRGSDFSIVGLEPGDYRVEIRIPGYLPAVIPALSLGEGQHLEGLRPSVGRGQRVSGVVRDGEGNAVSDVVVQMIRQGTPAVTQSTRSTDGGLFRLSGLLPGAYVLTTESRRHAQISISVDVGERGRTGLEVALKSLGNVSGSLSNGIASGGIVYAVPEGEDLSEIGERWIPGRIVDPNAGTYSVEGVPEGAYYLVVVAPGYLRTFFPGTADPEQAATITVLDGHTTRAEAFDVLAGSTLSGRMTDRDGEVPVAGATIEVASLDRRETLTARTDSEGYFSLSGVGSGRYLVKVRADGYIAQFFPGVTQAEEATALEVDGEKHEGNISIDLPRRQPADFNEDGRVDVSDLDRFVDRVVAGGITTSPVFDPNVDGLVTYDDFDFVTDQMRLEGRMIDPPTTITWKSADAEPGVLRASLRAEALVPAVGYLARLKYDTDVAEYVGKEAGESLFKDGRLRVEEVGPGVLMVLGGTPDSEEREGNGELISLLFRPRDGEESVRIRTDAVVALLGDGRMAAPVVPDPVRLTLPPETFYLLQNVPNPFNPETTIAYELPEAVQVQLVIFNLVGQRVRGLVDDFKAAGRYEAKWDARDDFGRDVSSGVYFYSLEAGSFSTTRRMLLIR